MSAGSGDPSGDTVAYTYRPSLLGAPWEFRLTGTAIEWAAGRQNGCVALSKVRQVRMSFKPGNMQTQRFVTEVWAEGAPKLAIVSASWKSMFEQERQDAPYAAFVAESHRRIARSGAPVSYKRGTHPLLYWPGVAAFAAVGLTGAILIVRALQADTKFGAAVMAVIIALFLWQGGNFVARNRPGVYRPDALPAQLMPRR